MRYFASALLTILIAAAAPGAALAAYTYTFQVQLAVTNAPAGAGIQTTCYLFSLANLTGSTTSGHTVVTVPANGSISAAPPNVSVNTGWALGSYRCMLFVFNPPSSPNTTNLTNGSYTSPQAKTGWTGTMWTPVVNCPC